MDDLMVEIMALLRTHSVYMVDLMADGTLRIQVEEGEAYILEARREA